MDLNRADNFSDQLHITLPDIFPNWYSDWCLRTRKDYVQLYKSKLARRGWIWMVVSPVSFILVLSFLVNPTGLLFYGIALTFTCAAAVFGIIAIFLQFTKKRRGIIDNLSNNSFGIYIIHYPIVIWLQFWLLEIQLPAILKASIVFFGPLIICWGFIAAIRRIPVVVRVI